MSHHSFFEHIMYFQIYFGCSFALDFYLACKINSWHNYVNRIFIYIRKCFTYPSVKVKGLLSYRSYYFEDALNLFEFFPFLYLAVSVQHYYKIFSLQDLWSYTAGCYKNSWQLMEGSLTFRGRGKKCHPAIHADSLFISSGKNTKIQNIWTLLNQF